MRRHLNNLGENKMKNTNYVITDKNTGEFYCVPMSGVDRNGEPTPTDTDFPYWSFEEDKACIFESELNAKNEMEFNDLTDDGDREPIICELVKGFVITWHNGRSQRYMDMENSDLGVGYEQDARLFDTYEEAQQVIADHDYANCSIIEICFTI